MSASKRIDRVGALRRVGQGAICVYLIGVLNEHSTALRQIGFYVALVTALALAAADRQRVAAIVRRPLAWWLAALALGSGVAVLVSPDVAYSAWEAYKEFGYLVLGATATALVVRSARDAEILMWASVVAAIDVSIYSLVQYAGEYRHAVAWPLPDIFRHRHYADPLLWFLPALLWAFARTRGRTLALAGVGLFAYLALLAGTGSRGAWYAGIIAGAAWFVTAPSPRRIALGSAALVAAVVLAFGIVPPPIFADQLTRGLWTAHRLHGAWIPALQLIAEHPWLGHGYGEDLFHAAYNAEVAAHPAWYFRHSLGPHNVFLALWFAGGVVLLGSFVGTLATCFRIVASTWPARDSRWRATLFAGACSVLGYIVLRGSVEIVSLRVCGPTLGIALAYAIERRGLVSADAARATAPSPSRPPTRPESA